MCQKVDKLLDQAAALYDIAKAKPIYDQIQRIVAEDGPYIYTIWRNELVAMDKKVQGFVWIPDLMVRFQPMWIKR